MNEPVTNWKDNNDGTQHCSKCDATFCVDESCNCPAGGTPLESRNASSSNSVSHAADDGVPPAISPLSYQSRTDSARDRMWEYVRQFDELADLAIGSTDQEQAGIRLAIMSKAEGRKALATVYEMDRQREELPEYVERAERAADRIAPEERVH